MADCLTPASISNIAKKDTNRLVGSVAKALAANSPYIGVLKGGVFASGVSDTVVSSVEMQAAPGDSLAAPTFTDFTAIAGTNGTQELTGKVDFSFKLQAKRGKGPRVNMQQGYSAFKSSYLTAEDALRKLITQYINADIQYNLVTSAATKFQCKAATAFDSLLLGGTEANIGQAWDASIVVDSPLSFKALHAIARNLKESLFGEMFAADGKTQPHFRFIGGSDIIEAFRNEVGVQNVLLALTQGGYKLGEEAVSAYSFETSPAYRGLAFGTAHRPLRFSAYGTSAAANIPTWINPVTVVTDSATNTAYAKANTAYRSATYEIGVLIAEGTFERQVPEKYAGEGSFKFAPQLHMGELDWHYLKDNDCNAWGDYGFHKYQVTRAYKPLRPQHIIPIMYKRATTDTGLTALA